MPRYAGPGGCLISGHTLVMALRYARAGPLRAGLLDDMLIPSRSNGCRRACRHEPIMLMGLIYTATICR